MGILCRRARGNSLIVVAVSPAPAHYAARVRDRGARFLARTPNPRQTDWKRHAYWRDIHDDLYQLHVGICMYCASWTPRRLGNSGTEHTSVDHFVPKSVDPPRAYAWDNFRLCRSRLNRRKSNFQDVLDPFIVNNDWFTLQFTTFLIVPTEGLARELATRVEASIDRLQLNADTDYVNERIGAVREYSLGKVTLARLRSKYPFIAEQMQRQDFDRVFKNRFETYFGAPR